MANQVIKAKMKLTINVDLVIVKEENYYVAYCPALELSSYGDSEESAKKAFDTEVSIFLEETHKRGTLEKYLLKNGWRLQQNPEAIYEPPRPNTQKLLSILKAGQDVIKQNIQLPVC